jgi:hypothetical protein
MLRSLEPLEVRSFLVGYANYEGAVTRSARKTGVPLALVPMKIYINWEVLAELTRQYQEEHPSRPLPEAVLHRALQKINDRSPVKVEGEEEFLVEAEAPSSPVVLRGREYRAGARYVLRKKQERMEQKVLRVGMARSPQGGPVCRTHRPSHPYQRSGAQ